MKIAQVAPLHESVPPRLYGGTERVVSWLTEALVRQGHEVTLFASGDSLTAGELVPCAPHALRLDPSVRDPVPHHVLALEKLRARADEFDIIHVHIDHLHFPLARMLRVPMVTTVHGRQDLSDIKGLDSAFADLPRVSISMAQRRPAPGLNWVGNVPHGLPETLLRPPTSVRDGYAAFLGRISPEKGPDRAIKIARRAGLPLRLAAKIDKADQDYFETRIEPLLETTGVTYVGEIDENEKSRFLGEAEVLLFPVDWPEPFGLVMIEAMACGTPVVAFRRGSVPEILEDGVTGFMVETIEEAADAVRSARRLDRRLIRRRFEERFTAERMAAEYVRIFERVVGLRESGRVVDGVVVDARRAMRASGPPGNDRPATERAGGA